MSTAKTSNIHARINPILKEKATRILDDLGISVTQFIELNFQQVIKNKAVQFELQLMKDDDEGNYITVFDAKRDNEGEGIEASKLLKILKKINGPDRKAISKNK